MRQWGVAGNSGRVFGAGRWQSGYTLIYDGTAPAEGFQIEYPSGLYANPNKQGQSNWKNYTLTPILEEPKNYLLGAYK